MVCRDGSATLQLMLFSRSPCFWGNLAANCKIWENMFDVLQFLDWSFNFSHGFASDCNIWINNSLYILRFQIFLKHVGWNCVKNRKWMSWFCTTNICLNVVAVSTRLLRGNHGWRLTACKHVVLATRCFWGNLAVTWSRRKWVKFWMFCNFQHWISQKVYCTKLSKYVRIQSFKARAFRTLYKKSGVQGGLWFEILVFCLWKSWFSTFNCGFGIRDGDILFRMFCFRLQGLNLIWWNILKLHFFFRKMLGMFQSVNLHAPRSVSFVWRLRGAKTDEVTDPWWLAWHDAPLVAMWSRVRVTNSLGRISTRFFKGAPRWADVCMCTLEFVAAVSPGCFSSLVWFEVVVGLEIFRVRVAVLVQCMFCMWRSCLDSAISRALSRKWGWLGSVAGFWGGCTLGPGTFQGPGAVSWIRQFFSARHSMLGPLSSRACSRKQALEACKVVACVVPQKETA